MIAPGITTVAGSLDFPEGVSVDSANNVYIVDSSHCVVRELAAATGTLTTLAGVGSCGYAGDGGPATSAELDEPAGVAFDSLGNIYIEDSGSSVVRKVNVSTGIITTVAGNGTAGYSGDGGPATSAEMSASFGIAVDSAGNLYLADQNNQRIRKVNAATGIITTVAGNGTYGNTGDGGVATSAELANPDGLAFDSAGNLYIAGDSGYGVIRKLAVSTGIITTVAGNGSGGYSGDGGAATSAQLNDPAGIVVDSSGNLFIADYGNNRIRKVTASTGIISTVVGNGSAGNTGDGGPATSAELNNPIDVAVNSTGILYVADMRNNSIRKVAVSTVFPTTPVENFSPRLNALVELTAVQSISSITAAPSLGGVHEYALGTITGCTVDGTTSNAIGTICIVPINFEPQLPGQRNIPLTVTTDTGTYSVALSGLATAPQVAFTPGTITSVAGNGTRGYAGDSGAATSAELNNPGGVAVDGTGNLYIADTYNNRIRKVDVTGTITTVAGNGSNGYSGDGGSSLSTELSDPGGVALDGAGNLYIADTNNNRIRKVDVSGTITTVAGNGAGAYGGDGGAAASAKLNYPGGVAVDSAGNLYIADAYNNRIRKVDVTGTITTVAGNGTGGYSGDGGPATSAELEFPYGVSVDNAGNLYIVDESNCRIRKVTAATGIITTLAGNGCSGYSGDGGPATSAELNYPAGVAVDSAGNLYIADFYNYVVRKVNSATGIITTVAGDGAYGFMGDGGAATSASIYYPTGIAVDSAGNLYIADEDNNRIRKVNVSTVPTINFATATNVGQTDGTDNPATVTVSNIGNEPLTITTPTTGTNPSYPANFPVNDGDLNLCSSSAASLSAGSSCDLSALFQPTSGGTNTGSVVIKDNALNVITYGSGSATQSISLSGIGIQAVAPTCTWPTGSSITYGQQLSSSALSGGSCTSSGTSVAGTFKWSSPTTAPIAGTSPESVIFTPSNTADYLTATGSVDVSVATATVVVDTASTVNPSTYGQVVTMTFALTGISGGPTPTGSLILAANGISLGTVNLASGLAMYTTGALPAGTNTITATYSGDSYYH